MTAYVILDIEVTDPEIYETYKKQAPDIIHALGGTYRVRGGAAKNLEGDWQPNRIVMLEFDNVAQARDWIDSDAYRAAKALRHQASVSRAIVVEGV